MPSGREEALRAATAGYTWLADVQRPRPDPVRPSLRVSFSMAKDRSPIPAPCLATARRVHGLSRLVEDHGRLPPVRIVAGAPRRSPRR